MTWKGGTLHLTRGSVGDVILSIEGGDGGHFAQLRLDFPQGSVLSGKRLSVPLGHFLTEIHRLANWPAEAVSWDPALAARVTSALQDSNIVDDLLATPFSIESETLTLESLTDRAASWDAPLTQGQLANVSRLVELRHGANFSVPGAGKTRTTLALYQLLKGQGTVSRAVIVAPKSAYGSWQSEIELCIPSRPQVNIIDGPLKQHAEITILNYERLQGLEGLLSKLIGETPTLLVLDEAHRMKRGSSGAYGSVCLSLGPLATRRLVLSGTPAPNGAQDLQALLEFLWPGQGAKLINRLSTTPAALSPLFVRTTKSDLRLPPMSIVTRRVPLPPLHRRIYDALVGRLALAITDNESVDDLGRIVVYLLMAATSPALLALGGTRSEALQFKVPPLVVPPGDRIRSLMADLPGHEVSPKIAETIRLVRSNAALGRKTLVWSTFHRNVNTLIEILGDLGAVAVTGASDDSERARNIEEFRKPDSDCMVLISNPATLGEGISLHDCCHDAVYLDRDFAAGRFLQSLDRIHRLGLKADQETRVTVLVSEGTIDELVESRLDAKIRFMQDVLDDRDLKELTDLEEDREYGPVLDVSDHKALFSYLDSINAS